MYPAPVPPLFRGLLLVVLISSGCTPESGEEATATEQPTVEIWTEGPPLPQPTTNNAVAAVTVDDDVAVFSFLGLDSTKIWSGVHSRSYRWDTSDPAWREIESVPGPGRLASTAQVVDGKIYVIGGYTVAEDGSERSLPDVAIYDPVAESWSAGADIPIPTDDAVAGVWRARYVVLVSGWHDTDNVRDVQLYDTESDRWLASTEIAGAPVFGHTGAVVGDEIVYVDGTAVVDARPRFVIDTATWRGRIDGATSPNIEWGLAPAHPGPPLYRAAAGAVAGLAIFVGGSSNPYNYNGIGYNGEPSEPLRQILAFSPATGSWSTLSPLPRATMDHRNVGVAEGRLFVVGGMLESQVVSDRVWWVRTTALLEPS